MKKIIKITTVLSVLFLMLSFIGNVNVSPKDFFGKWKVENIKFKKKFTHNGKEVEKIVQDFAESTAFKFVKIKKDKIYFIDFDNKIKDELNYKISDVKVISDTVFVKDVKVENKEIKLIQIEKNKKLKLEGKFFIMDLRK